MSEVVIKQIEDLIVKLIEANTRLSAENKHVNVAFLGSEITRWKEKFDAKLALFDGNHTLAQAKLCDRMKALEERTKALPNRGGVLRTSCNRPRREFSRSRSIVRTIFSRCLGQ